MGNISLFYLQGVSLPELLLTFLGPGLVLFFTFYLLWSGRRKNHKIIKLARESLLEVFSNEFEDLVIDQLSSNGGILFPKYKRSPSLSFRDFRVVFALEERHLMLSVIISLFSGTNDYIALEANPKKGKVPTTIQIIPRKEEGQIKKHQDLLFELDDVELGVKKLEDFFVMKSGSKRMGTYFLGEKNLLRIIHSTRNIIVRISINSTDDPSIRVYARINPDLDLDKLYHLFIGLCERVNEVSEKKVMKKKYS
ncbi:MAG: hypothetical protein ACFFAU_06470 [Candidatus Hodarchaeota archaeon]